MKAVNFLAALACLLVSSEAVTDQSVTVASVDAQITDGPGLEKRFKDVIINKNYKELESLRAHGSASATNTLKPWVRTIYGSKVEIVTPTLIAGVTISGKPPATTNGLEPWISLNKDGSPKTIKPKMKNGVIKDKSPDYGTYFQTATTIRYTKEELKAHNMADDEVFHEETFVEEDLTYRMLNPILRCTPDSYKMKGLGKEKSPEPFCFPRDNTRLYKERTYFVTWYYRFFDDSVKNVKLHLSYVKESLRQKGTKRELDEESSFNASKKRSTIMEQGGSLGEASFFASEWLPKEEGMFPLEINPDWLDGEYYKKVLISLQPDDVSDEEFDHMSNFIVIEIAQQAKVAKGHGKDIADQEQKQRMKALYGDSYDVEEGIDYEKYIIIMTMPTCVLLAVLFMYLFVWYNSRDHDLSFLKNVKFKKRKPAKIPFRAKKESKYTELPQWSGPKAD